MLHKYPEEVALRLLTECILGAIAVGEMACDGGCVYSTTLKAKLSFCTVAFRMGFSFKPLNILGVFFLCQILASPSLLVTWTSF